MAHPTPIKVLLTTTLQPLTMELSGSLAHGARLVEQFLEHEPSPEKMMRFECELGALLREVGRRIVAWVLNRLEPERDDAAPSVVSLEDRLYRRRRKYRGSISTVFGTVEVWRRLYAPLRRGVGSIHPLELRLGIEAGLATSPGHDLFYTSGSVSRLDSEPLPRITKLDFSWLSDLVPSKCPVSLVSHSQQGSHDQAWRCGVAVTNSCD